jgi:hypothetical protein
MKCGDVESAMWARFHALCYTWFASRPLGILEGDLKADYRMMQNYQQNATLAALLPFWQAILNLMGKSSDPKVLSGEAMSQEDVLRVASENDHHVVITIVNSLRMELAYLFHDYESAGTLAENLRDPHDVFPGFFQICRHYFFECLTSIALAKTTKLRKWKCHAVKIEKKIRKWAKSGKFNCVHMLCLLEAEMAMLKGKTKEATASYDEAIALAARSGFVQDRALAHERAALYFLDRNDEFWASYHISRARQCYTYWGASAKVQHLEKDYPDLLNYAASIQCAVSHDR